MANKTGKGGFTGRNDPRRNNDGVPKGLKQKYASYRTMVLDWADNPQKFKKWADENPSEAYKLANGLVPKEIDLGGEVKHQWIVTRYAQPPKPE